jgi:hypothetical protein
MKFKIWASSTSIYSLEIEAESEDEAYKIAKNADGGDFEPVPYSGDWQIDDIEQIEG